MHPKFVFGSNDTNFFFYLKAIDGSIVSIAIETTVDKIWKKNTAVVSCLKISVAVIVIVYKGTRTANLSVTCNLGVKKCVVNIYG